MFISWNVTRACNLRCKHCYINAGSASPRELTFEEGKKLLDTLAEMGGNAVIISGGEALMRKDVFDLIQHGSAKGLTMVLGTNGTLIDESVGKRLKEVGVSGVGISLDSVSPEEHDEFRGVKGAWRSAVRAIKACVKADLYVQVHTVVRKVNSPKQVFELVKLSSDLGASAFLPFFLVPTGRGEWAEFQPLEVEEVMGKIFELQEKSLIPIIPSCIPQYCRFIAQKIGYEKAKEKAHRIGCSAGIRYCRVMPEGDVTPCAFLPLKLGNVRREDFWNIWRRAPVFQALRRKEFKGKCGACRYKDLCGGCRARAYARYGDYLAEDPWCAYNGSS